jgi:hypothetical protein
LERKYSHRGYMDSDAPKKKEKRLPENRPHQEQIGPRTPRMVGTITLARCSNCGAVLQRGFDPSGQCPRCGFELHSCKQCMHFDTGAQFECNQPIPERIAKKDARNDCTFYAFRTTVEKDTAPTVPSASAAPSNGGSSTSRPNDARKAFDNLFKK